MKIARIIDGKDNLIHAGLKPDGTMQKLDGDLFTGFKETSETVDVKRWLSPVDPKVIICIASNYKAHIDECDMKVPDYPVFFMKNLSAVNPHLAPICLPNVCEDEVDYEGELAVVIGKTCCNVTKEEALDYVLGYTVANDISARVWQQQKGGGQWCRGKGFDGFCPLGPVLITKDEIKELGNLKITTKLNGQIVQDGNTNLMIFDTPTLISFLSQDTTLLPGTVILTGTPAGVGWTREPKLLLKDGDTVSVEIESIGKLVNPIMKKSV
jgi:2-keto-4-pentenoate hydratase/2-oxohepta-3-ene-1,7-dioic acid hydratase in catechol pathway